jgi:hypothetical protein
MTCSAIRITVLYDDGMESTFIRRPDGSWTLDIKDLPVRISEYDGPNILRVIGNALGTHEVAP